MPRNSLSRERDVIMNNQNINTIYLRHNVGREISDEENLMSMSTPGNMIDGFSA